MLLDEFVDALDVFARLDNTSEQGPIGQTQRFEVPISEKFHKFLDRPLSGYNYCIM